MRGTQAHLWFSLAKTQNSEEKRHPQTEGHLLKNWPIKVEQAQQRPGEKKLTEAALMAMLGVDPGLGEDAQKGHCGDSCGNLNVDEGETTASLSHFLFG